jgi:hypothetical protein
MQQMNIAALSDGTSYTSAGDPLQGIYTWGKRRA